MKIIYLLLFISTFLLSDIYEYDIRPSSIEVQSLTGIKILDSKELKFSQSDVSELSALAYKDGILYALGDRGFLYHFDIKIQNDKIKNLSVKKVLKLKNKKNKRLKNRDSEGLAFTDENLLISFERKPRVGLFSKSGVKLDEIDIYDDLKDIKNYQGENKALESVAFNKKYGVLTAPEKPLAKDKKSVHTIYSKNNRWSFDSDGEISALEFINEDEIMILQRKLKYLATKAVVTISKLNLKNNDYKILAVLDSKDGWKIDNFEGLTKVDEKRFLMVSDDNESFLQKTLLVLFELN